MVPQILPRPNPPQIPLQAVSDPHQAHPVSISCTGCLWALASSDEANSVPHVRPGTPGQQMHVKDNGIAADAVLGVAWGTGAEPADRCWATILCAGQPALQP